MRRFNQGLNSENLKFFFSEALKHSKSDGAIDDAERSSKVWHAAGNVARSADEVLTTVAKNDLQATRQNMTQLVSELVRLVRLTTMTSSEGMAFATRV